MLDEISLKILNILQEKARIPNVEVARQVAMAPSAVLERIRKLDLLRRRARDRHRRGELPERKRVRRIEPGGDILAQLFDYFDTHRIGNGTRGPCWSTRDSGVLRGKEKEGRRLIRKAVSRDPARRAGSTGDKAALLRSHGRTKAGRSGGPCMRGRSGSPGRYDAPSRRRTRPGPPRSRRG